MKKTTKYIKYFFITLGFLFVILFWPIIFLVLFLASIALLIFAAFGLIKFKFK